MKKPLIGIVCFVLLWTGTLCRVMDAESAQFPRLNEKTGNSTATDSTKDKNLDSHVEVQHDFNHREQVIAGGVFMLCLTLMLVSVNNYNPQKK